MKSSTGPIGELLLSTTKDRARSQAVDGGKMRCTIASGGKSGSLTGVAVIKSHHPTSIALSRPLISIGVTRHHLTASWVSTSLLMQERPSR